MDKFLTKRRFLSDHLDILVEGCRNNNLQSQHELYKLCYPDMIKVCYRYAPDADGAGTIYNDAMLKVFTNIHKYTDEGKLLGWIKTIVINCSIDFCKKKNIFKESVPYVSQEEPILNAEAFDLLSGKEIQQLIAQLPPMTATVFNLFVYEGYTHKQIGEKLSISDNTSKWHVSEAKKILKQKLENLSEPHQLKTNAAG